MIAEGRAPPWRRRKDRSLLLARSPVTLQPLRPLQSQALQMTREDELRGAVECRLPDGRLQLFRTGQSQLAGSPCPLLAPSPCQAYQVESLLTEHQGFGGACPNREGPDLPHRPTTSTHGTEGKQQQSATVPR